MSALQGWIFGMRYLHSANVSSLTKQWLKADTVIKIGIAVGLMYLALQTVAFLVLIISFPGYNNERRSFKSWLQETFMPWFDAQNIAFCVLTIVSTVITIYSICKIFETSKQLSATNQNVHINLRTMICHSSLLIVSSLIAIGYNTPYD